MTEVTKLPFAKPFRELLVYQKAYALSLEVHELSLDFPKHEMYGGVGDQMRRASKGICANIAEGYGKTVYPAEWKRFLLMALGSAQEMQVWADYAADLAYISRKKSNDICVRYVEVSKMLQGLIK